MVTQFFLTLSRYPKTLVLVYGVLSIFFGFQAQQSLLQNGKLLINSTLEPFISRGSDDFSFFHQTQQTFGNESVLIVAFHAESQKSFDLNFLHKLNQFTQTLPDAIPGISQVLAINNIPQFSGPCASKSYFHEETLGSVCQSWVEQYVLQKDCPLIESSSPPLSSNPSLTFEDHDPFADSLSESLSDLEDEDSGEPMMGVCMPFQSQMEKDQWLQQAEAASQQVLQKIAQMEMHEGDFISSDAQTLGVLIQFQPEVHAATEAIQMALRAQLEPLRSDTIEVSYAGDSRQEYEAARLIREDLKTILPFSLLLMMTSLFMCFRQVGGMLIPLVLVVLGILWTAGVFGILGDQLNLVTMACPPILISVGSAYVIHLLNQYYQELELAQHNQTHAIEKTISHLVVPLGVTAFTTVSGFGALTVSPIPAVKELGLYSCIGVAFIIFMSLTLAPALLQLLPVSSSTSDLSNHSWLDSIFQKLSQLLEHHSKKLIYVWGGIGVIALLGVFYVSVDSSSKSFKEESELNQDLERIEASLAGTNSLRVIFEYPEEPQYLQSPAFFQVLSQWVTQLPDHEALKALEGVRVDKVYSPIPYFDQYFSSQDDVRSESIQWFLQKLHTQTGLKFYDAQTQQFQITLRTKMEGSSAFIELREWLQQSLNAQFPGVSIRFTGGGVLASESANNIAQGQIQSVILALSIIFVILSVLFLSPKMGVIALYPNIVAVLIFFGFLGWFSIPIGVTISVIASIALGIGVDDTIHFLSHYNETVKKTRNERVASQQTVQHLGKPILFTTLSLAMGFIVFVLSDMESQVWFGALLTFTLMVCLVTDLTFLPSIMMETKLITAWDYLGLKFDESFLKGVGIFQGMSLRETKIATLMAYTAELEEGDVLFQENDTGNELFVILQGEIEVYLDAAFHPHETSLAKLSKGFTFGEMGLFRNATRAASARATTSTQLLVINQKTLDRLQLRYPGIAAKLFMNLARGLTHSINNTNLHIVGQRQAQPEAQEASMVDTEKSGEAGDIFKDVFQQMNFLQKWHFQRYCRVEPVHQGQTLFHQGEPGNNLVILHSGAFEVHLQKEGQEIRFQKKATNEILGEAAVINHPTVRQATVTVLEDSEAWYLEQADLQKMMRRHKRLAARFAHNLVCLLSSRLEETTSQLTSR